MTYLQVVVLTAEVRLDAEVAEEESQPLTNRRLNDDITDNS